MDTTTEDRYDTRSEDETGHHSDRHYVEAAAAAAAARAARAAETVPCTDCGDSAPRSEMHNAGNDWYCTPCGFGV